MDNITFSNKRIGSDIITSLPPSSWCFMYVETSANNHGPNHVIVSWETTDIIHTSNIKNFYKRFSTFDPNLRGMGRLRIQLLLEDNSWSTIYNIPKNSHFSNGIYLIWISLNKIMALNSFMIKYLLPIVTSFFQV